MNNTALSCKKPERVTLRREIERRLKIKMTSKVPAIKRAVCNEWDAALPTLCDYTKIENRSPAFVPPGGETAERDATLRVVALLREWISAQHIDGLTQELLWLPGKTPLLARRPTHRWCSCTAMRTSSRP